MHRFLSKGYRIVNLMIKQESKLLFCYDLTQDWLQPLGYNLYNYFVYHIEAGYWPEFFKGGRVLFLRDESQECGIQGSQYLPRPL